MPIDIISGNPYYYTDEFKTTVRSCKELLLERASWAPFVDDSTKFAYKYNFHKFLRQLKRKDSDGYAITEDLIWVTAFLNGIEDPNQDFSHLKGIFTISAESIDYILQVNRVRRE